MLKNYLKENPGANIEKIEEESDEEKENDKIIDSSNSDIILSLFTKVVNYDKKQVIRYYRNNFYPLWFTQEKMLTTKKTKCTNCGGDVVFEFQIMPYLFLIEPKIAFNDIGTIVIYTCKNCCDSKIEGGFVEEHGFIQRTGENFRDLNDNDNKYLKNKKIKEDIKEIKEEKEYDNMIKNYLKENPGANIEKVEAESDDEKENDKIIDSTNQDIIMNLFTKVINYDKKQVVRFYRNNFYPLWFTQEKMITTKNTKCTNCGGNVEFEFQIMPYLFLIQPKIAFNDIGTIVIYTCRKCCDSKIEGGFVQEYGFIQRTGENFRDLKDNENTNNKNKQLQKETEKIIEDNEFFAGVNEKDADEEGFVEVKKKKNKKHKKNKDDDKDDEK